MSFSAGIGPNALALGDFNGDGRVDVAVADSSDSIGDGQGGVTILLGNGDGTFQDHDPPFYPTGNGPSSIVAGDFTGNGILDLAVANQYSSSVSILLGDGHGGFTTLPQIVLGGGSTAPVSIVCGEFTGNGIVDLAVADQSNDEVWILVGDGRGNFVPLPAIPLGDDPFNLVDAIVAGNFSGHANGLLDLAVATSNSVDAPDSVSILLARGDGRFDLQQPIPLGTQFVPSSITTGNFFGGGTLDLAVADFNANGVSLLQGNGLGGFTLVSLLSIGSGLVPTVVTTGDFTGDRKTDLAIATASPNSVAIELNQGDGQFTPPGSVVLAAHNTPLVADLNGDGVPDVAIVDGAGDILFRPGQPNQPGTFGPPVTVNARHPGSIFLARPSRDIAAVTTNHGTLLASVDANQNAVSLFAYGNGGWSLVGSLATGVEPAQIVSADLLGNGLDDLVIRNAGDGTLTVYMSNSHGGFLSPITLPVGPGISDVSVADVNQDGLLDILLANQTAGEVEVILNQGAAGFGPPTLYQAGTGLSAVIDGPGTTALSMFSQEVTVGVAAATLTPGASPDLLALNAGSDTIGVLQGLGDGRFANPTSVPTVAPTIAVRVADFNQDGNPDLAILNANGLSIWLGNGRGGFALTYTYDVGPDPTGLTIADLNGDSLPDITVGNAFGDVLVLLIGAGNGAFRQPSPTDQNVGFAVDPLAGQIGPTFVFVDQARDRIVVQHGLGGKPTVLADRTTGLLVPGAPVLADLSGDGMKDLIVPNGGGNNVLVYPALPGGGFGPALNDGQGFFTGTNPVSVVVADVNGDGRPDLIVANRGSNDVSILLNEPVGSSFTFVPGERLNAGAGPVGVLYGDFNGDGFPDLLVSDSGSNDLMMLTGLGNGFFNFQNPTIIPLAESPGPIFAGQFEGDTSLDVVALDPGTGSVTLITGLATDAPTSEIFDSGGFDPVAAFTVLGSNGFLDLVVADKADGSVGGTSGG